MVLHEIINGDVFYANELTQYSVGHEKFSQLTSEDNAH